MNSPFVTPFEESRPILSVAYTNQLYYLAKQLAPNATPEQLKMLEALATNIKKSHKYERDNAVKNKEDEMKLEKLKENMAISAKSLGNNVNEKKEDDECKSKDIIDEKKKAVRFEPLLEESNDDSGKNTVVVGQTIEKKVDIIPILNKKILELSKKIEDMEDCRYENFYTEDHIKMIDKRINNWQMERRSLVDYYLANMGQLKVEISRKKSKFDELLAENSLMKERLGKLENIKSKEDGMNDSATSSMYGGQW